MSEAGARNSIKTSKIHFFINKYLIDLIFPIKKLFLNLELLIGWQIKNLIKFRKDLIK